LCFLLSISSLCTSFHTGGGYTGEWNKGVKVGAGEGKWDDGKVYKGQWEDDKKHGKGKLTWSTPDAGTGVITGEYIGEWLYGNRVGEGTLTMR